ncbi:MAG: acetolactate synthase small subunit [Clostridia bacterium]|nr:acetolactate synthase small subunit [Clostridia bacterium]
MERYTLSVLVENHPGVLSRVVGLFSRRGFNIYSLSVGTTVDDTVSRITIEVEGDSLIVEQVSKQLSKLMEVIKIKTLPSNEMVKRGLILCKVRVSPKTRGEVIEITNIFRAKIIDISPSTMTIELTGNDKKLDAFLDMISIYGIEEIARTGMTALERGANVLKLDKNS